MKKILTLAAVTFAFSLSAYSQGAVAFKNFGNGANGTIAFGSAHVFNIDGTTPLSGTGFSAELFDVSSSTSLSIVNFATGALAGTFSSTPSVLVPGVNIGANATLQVRAWDNVGGTINSYDAASIRGESNEITVALGDPQNPTSLPILVGMQSFSVVPEPSVIALAILGGGLLLFRRKK